MTKLLSHLIRINSRFTRSVNLERDFFSSASVEGYVMTTTARRTLQRVTEGLCKQGGARAWTLTGPFGSGKSAFALYLASLLTANDTARVALKEEEPGLFRSLFDSRTRTALPKGRFLPVLATGAREPVEKALLRGLLQGLRFLGTPVAMHLSTRVADRLEQVELLGDRKLVEFFEMVIREVVGANEAIGSVLVLDELGKHLEFAAINADSGDLYVLQSLAEMAERSQQAPVLVLTLLHQSFERYAERLTAVERAEWSKVQGRFEDVAFQESQEQIVRLISRALDYAGSPETLETWNRLAIESARQAARVDLRPSAMNPTAFEEQVAGVYPIHPTVAFILGPLFRKLAQNERSLFAFLSAHEPFGFQDFLLTTEFAGESAQQYTIDRLYDYVVQAFGGALHNTASGRRWAEIEMTLARLGDSTALERRLVKVVGMLSVVGQLGDLKPSLEMISFAVDEPSSKVHEAVQRLCDRSILVFRSFQGAYGLWEGSDFDLESALASARHQVSLEESIPTLLEREQPIRPLVARRHSIQTGTLRYFEVRYALAEELAQVVSEPLAQADGIIVLTFPVSHQQKEAVREFANDVRHRPEVLLVEPGNTPVLHGYLHDLSCLRWILRNTTELAGDAVARREVFSRISALQRTAKDLLDSLLDDASTTGHWYHRGQSFSLDSRRSLTVRLSEICDEVYSETPVITNELVNRRQLSSAAAAARNSLLQAMLDHQHEPLLGMAGHPPARSIYESLFAAPGIHREESGRWAFYTPTPENSVGITPLWRAMESFLDEAEGSKRCVGDLFAILQASPIGLKAGCLPLYFASFLLAKEAEAALYEEGAFIPELTLPHFERLIKTPQKFELQRFRVSGVRSQVFDQYISTFHLEKGAGPRTTDLLDVVRPLCHFAAKLPPYSRHTQQVSEQASSIRRVLFKAQEPAKLLFVDLPVACNLEPFESAGEQEEMDEYFRRLRAGLKELQTSYDRLLDEAEQRFGETFALRRRGHDAREEFRGRALGVLKLALDDQLKSFLLRATDDRLEIKGWIESVATVLVSKPPKTWTDRDRAVFEVNLREMARKYNQLEALALEVEGGLLPLGDNQVYCVGITSTDAAHAQQVVRVTAKEARTLDSAEKSLRDWLKKSNVGGNEELQLALLARLSKNLIAKLNTSEPTAFAASEDQPGLLDEAMADDS
jgi:hypothetical protein